MASIERTAYPRFPRTLTLKDLQVSFSPRPEEAEWARNFSRNPDRRLALLVLLKCSQFLRHFPALEAIPAEVVEHVSATLAMPPEQKIEYPVGHTALYRHHKAIRALLGVKPYTDDWKVILQNTVDMMRIMQEMYAVGEPVTATDAEYMSPYGTYGVNRFGKFHLDLKRPPEPWLKESLFRDAV